MSASRVTWWFGGAVSQRTYDALLSVLRSHGEALISITRATSESPRLEVVVGDNPEDLCEALAVACKVACIPYRKLVDANDWQEAVLSWWTLSDGEGWCYSNSSGDVLVELSELRRFFASDPVRHLSASAALSRFCDQTAAVPPPLPLFSVTPTQKEQ